MNTKGYANIPDALFEAITFLAHALPKRSAPTWLAIKPKRHWTQKKAHIPYGVWAFCTLPDVAGTKLAASSEIKTHHTVLTKFISITFSLLPPKLPPSRI